MKSGGFMDTANGKNVRVNRVLPDGSFKLFEKLDVESLILGKTAQTNASNFIVEPGDTIYVPERII
jgi:polysaccharide export outer membrane protein